MTVIFCPNCARIIEKNHGGRDGFIEIGRYDEHRDRYEEEYDLDGYRCTVCKQDFWVLP